jgi:TetR/AcrR family transcriptional repressor of nem operon
VARREAVLTLSALVGAISLARAIDDPDLSQAVLTDAAAALKERASGRI